LPGQTSPDYFYQYSALPTDNGKVGDQTGYFGYKVLAVSYGGTLNLFGEKGAVYGSLEPKATGRSWVRLDGTILGTLPGVPGATSLKVANPVDWQAGDHIVVTTTDYLPNHSEELIICSVSGSTISFTANLTAARGTCPAQGVQWTHTIVQDSSINESMTRWITVHGTQDLTLARNVGYLSIGHGFYLEDAVETDNKFYSNLGIFARAAVTNAQNPRNVPGVLASPDDTPGSIQFGSDKSTPAAFWITNGWNDFQGNMAAGAGLCGVCYWEVPASISGPSRNETWESYASEQTATRIGSSPHMNFDGNYCTSAMTAFQDVGFTIDCPGVGSGQPAVPVMNPMLPPQPPAPQVAVRARTRHYVPPTIIRTSTTANCFKPRNALLLARARHDGPLCANSNETNCLPNIINDFTTSFNYSSIISRRSGSGLAGTW
jgi:hypothetical protein